MKNYKIEVRISFGVFFRNNVAESLLFILNFNDFDLLINDDNVIQKRVYSQRSWEENGICIHC